MFTLTGALRRNSASHQLLAECGDLLHLAARLSGVGERGLSGLDGLNPHVSVQLLGSVCTDSPSALQSCLRLASPAGSDQATETIGACLQQQGAKRGRHSP